MIDIRGTSGKTESLQIEALTMERNNEGGGEDGRPYLN